MGSREDDDDGRWAQPSISCVLSWWVKIPVKMGDLGDDGWAETAP